LRTGGWYRTLGGVFRFAVLAPRALDRAAMTAASLPVSSGLLSSGLLSASGARG
jgi:hypothetical protein